MEQRWNTGAAAAGSRSSQSGTTKSSNTTAGQPPVIDLRFEHSQSIESRSRGSIGRRAKKQRLRFDAEQQPVNDHAQ